MPLQLKGGNNELDSFKLSNKSSYLPNEYEEPIELEQKIHQTTVIPKEDSVGKKLVSLIIKLVIFMIIIGGILKIAPMLIEKADAKIRLDDYVNASQATFEKELGLTFQNNPNIVRNLPLASLDGITAVTAEQEPISIIYQNGKQVGFFFTSKSYSLYNIKIGSGEKKVYDDTTYAFYYCWELLKDIGGISTASYYGDQAETSYLVVVFNNTSHRAAAVAYFTDCSVVLKGLDVDD